MKFGFRGAVCAAALAFASFTSTGSKADHWMATADPTVLNAINELIYVVGASCQAGNQQACRVIPQMQQEAAMMLSAGYDCQVYRDQQACQFYQYSLVELNQAYNATAQALAQGQIAPPSGAYSQSTHMDRMQQIHDWGASRLDWGAARQDMMDSSHQSFMEMLGQ